MVEKNSIIEINNLSKKYKLYEHKVIDRLKDVFMPSRAKIIKDFFAVKDLNLKIYEGDVIGVIGRNGAGKSTLLKLISRITFPTSGNIKVKGKIVPLLELGGGFNPDYTGRENIRFYCTLQGLSESEINQISPKIIDFCRIR